MGSRSLFVPKVIFKRHMEIQVTPSVSLKHSASSLAEAHVDSCFQYHRHPNPIFVFADAKLFFWFCIPSPRTCTVCVWQASLQQSSMLDLQLMENGLQRYMCVEYDASPTYEREWLKLTTAAALNFFPISVEIKLCCLYTFGCYSLGISGIHKKSIGGLIALL